MLTYTDLADLEHALGERTVLSVYINGEEKDPARRRRWRIELKNSLDDIESWLTGSSHAEREGFAKARDAVLKRLAAVPGVIRTPGWAGFYTTEGEHHAGPVPAPVPAMAVWSTGPCLTPYVRALKEARPVLVVVADRRKAQLFKYAERKVELVDKIEAVAEVAPPYHMSKPPRQGFHPGTRGRTGTDEVQREIHDATMHMLTEVAEKISKVDNSEAWIVVGGIPNVAAAALTRLPEQLRPRATHAEGLDVHVTKAQVADWARQSASAMRDRLDFERISDALDSAASNGLGATGPVDTKIALDQGRARELYFTLAFLESNPSDAELAVRKALGTRAQVEHVSGEAAELLDSVGGIAARLRYALPPAVVAQTTGRAT